MSKHPSENSLTNQESPVQDTVDKIRWSLRQRLCEHMRRLNTDLFDELDDFLFSGAQPEELTEGSSQLRLIREFRNKKQLFEERFLASINGALQATLVPTGPAQRVLGGSGPDNTPGSAYEKMEVDLALERMQRKAFKHYADRINELAACSLDADQAGAGQIIPEKRDILIGNTLRALAQAHPVFRVPLESRLIFLKLFEKHFLLEMDKLYQDVISIIHNKDNRQFVARLYASSTSMARKRSSSQLKGPALTGEDGVVADQYSVSERVAGKVQELVEAWCRQAGLPQFVAEMLRNDWYNVMFLMGLNKGVETREWCETRRTAELLLQRLADQSQGVEHRIELTQVEDRLRDGFALSHKDAADQEAFFKALAQHLASQGVAGGDTTSVIVAKEPVKPAGGSFAAVSEAGRKILDSSDLDDFMALLSDEQEQAIAEVEEEAISMEYYLNMVDLMADRTAAEVRQKGAVGLCSIQKSSTIEHSYQILDAEGHVLLTRGRVGLAVSLKSGEIRLAGQEDFTVLPTAGGSGAEPGNRPFTTH